MDVRIELVYIAILRLEGMQIVNLGKSGVQVGCKSIFTLALASDASNKVAIVKDC